MMKKKALGILTTAALAFTLAAPSVFADESSSATVTRGQFFKQVTDHLKLQSTEAGIALPKDVSADSAYAGTVRALLERKIIDGYPDGTFRTEQPITKEEAGYVLARLLGVDDREAAEQLSSKFGVSFGSGAAISAETAAKAIRSALTSDASALDWFHKSSAKHLELTSFAAAMEQQIKITTRPAAAEGLNSTTPEAVTTTAKNEVVYHKDQGIHLKLSAAIPGLDGGAMDLKVEQYIVPQGTFMKMTNPLTKQDQWMNLSKQMPYGFAEMMALQKNSLELNKMFSDKYFFYRDLGSEEKDGKKLHKIEVNGKISSIADIVKTMSAIVPDQNSLQSLIQTPGMDQMSVAMNGTMWIDEKTLLMEKMDARMSLKYGDAKDIPIEKMDMTMTTSYKDFDKIDQITVPAEALNAPEPPAGIPPLPTAN